MSPQSFTGIPEKLIMALVLVGVEETKADSGIRYCETLNSSRPKAPWHSVLEHPEVLNELPGSCRGFGVIV